MALDAGCSCRNSYGMASQISIVLKKTGRARRPDQHGLVLVLAHVTHDFLMEKK